MTGSRGTSACSHLMSEMGQSEKHSTRTDVFRSSPKKNVVLAAPKLTFVATKLRCLCLCKVEMSLGGRAGSVSRRRGDHPIGAASASAASFRLRFGYLGHSQGT